MESFFNLEYCKIFKSSYFKEHLQTAASENDFIKLRKNKNCSSGFLTSANVCFYFMKETSENACFYFMIGFLWRLYSQILLRRVRKFKKRICQGSFNFDQWKTFSENYKLIRVWLWFVYKFTENNCCSRLYSEFIQTQKRYLTSLEKICILPWKVLVISS